MAAATNTTTDNSLLRIVVTGDANAGKTSLMNRVCRDQWQTTYSTVGFEFNTLVHESRKIQFWDSSGGDRFRSLVPMYYRRIDQVWIVLNGGANTATDTVYEQARYWFTHARVYTDRPILLIVNKANEGDDDTFAKFDLTEFGVPVVSGSAKFDTQAEWLKKTAMFFPGQPSTAAPASVHLHSSPESPFSCCTWA